MAPSNLIPRFRAKRERLERFHGLLPESQGQNLASTVSYMPLSLDRGWSIYYLYCESATFGEEQAFLRKEKTLTSDGLAPYARSCLDETSSPLPTSGLGIIIWVLAFSVGAFFWRPGRDKFNHSEERGFKIRTTLKFY